MEISRRRKDRKTTSLDTDQHSSSPPLLPMDLMMDIFSRLSLIKSTAICRCVSKQWGYVLGHPDFRDLRLTRSQARPRLLFACFGGNKLFFLSSPQPQSTDEMFAADHHMSFSFPRPVKEVSTSVGGFVCVSFSGYQSGRKFMAAESVVCNPSTGQSLIIPRMKTMKRTGMIRFFGIGGGNERATWRMAECGIPCGIDRIYALMVLSITSSWLAMGVVMV
uniref:F-box domain-containing protein n=1 Tax=Brassica oleracea TaxID=3712 RepID=A0A3P6CLM1_BRAOL|nr:unnamed protein product [Brassica oleracea]